MLIHYVRNKKAAAGASFTPADLYTGGEKGGWYDFSDLSALWANTAGSTPASVGNPILRADDKSGNGNHWLQSNSSLAPVLRQDGSGNYYAEFAAGDTLSATITGVSLTEAMTAIGGQADGVVTQFGAAWGQALPAGATERMLIHPAYDGTMYFDSFNATGGRISASLSGSYVLEVVTANAASGGARTYRRNGSVFASGTSTDTSSASLTRLYAQAVNDGYNLYGAIFLDREATAGEISNIETWLAAKTGVTL